MFRISKSWVKNLSAKQSDDVDICDNPTEIFVEKCTTDAAKNMLSLALSSKMAGQRMHHQAIVEYSSSPCVVKPYELGIEP